MAFSAKVRCNFLLCATISSCLIQSGISILLVLVGIQVHECNINIFQRRITNSYDTFTRWETARFLTYLTYFRNNCTWLSLDEGWSKSSPTSYRTYNWMLVYLVINFVWMFTAVLLLVAVLGKKQLNHCDRFYFCYPWIFTSVVVICTDAIATAHYALDLVHTMEPQHYFHFIGFRGNYSTTIEGHNYAMPRNLYTPSVTMALIFSKGVVLWLINAVACISASTRLLASPFESKTGQQVEPSGTTTPNADPNAASDEATSQIAAQHELPAIVSSAATEQGYVPWMNVLYVPKTTYEDYTNSECKIEGEHHYEHHYEKVICPGDLRRSLNMGISRRIANDSASACCRHAADGRAGAELKEMKINVGNVSISIKHREATTPTVQTKLAANYSQLRIIRIPRLSSGDGYDSSRISADSIETSC